MLAKLILFHSTVQIAVVLLIRKRMGLFFIKNHLLRCFYCFSLLNWIVALILSLLLKLPPRKLAPWFILWSFFLLRLLFIFMNIPSALAWNTVVMSGMEAPIDTWIFFNKLQKRLCRDFGPTPAVSPNPLAHLRNVASLNLLYSLHIRGSLDALIGCMVFCYHF